MNRRLSLAPSSARPSRVDAPRRRASCPSAESKISETMNSPNPMRFVQRSWYANRCPATTPITSDHNVTWSAEIPVGTSARAIRMPIGRKKWRSTHSSTACPLCDKSLCGFTEHVFHRGERTHRLLLLDHEGWVNADLGVVDHRQHTTRQQRVENPACGLLVEQPARPRHDQVHPEQQPPPAHVRDDRELGFPTLHFREHLATQAARMLHQTVLHDRLDRHVCGRRGERIAAIRTG